MDANVFIKNVTTEGNKIIDIQFNGDWEIDLGSGTNTEIVVGNGIEFKVDTTDEFLSKGSGNYIRFTYPTTGIWSDIVRLRGSIVDGKFTLKNQNPILMTRNLSYYPYDELWASSGSDLFLMFDGEGHYYGGYILTNGNKNLH
jgi:hypothetical protein